MYSTHSIYSPECMAVYKATGQTRYPNIHVWVEGIGKHIFETERDVYTSVPLNIKIAGNASSARGNIQLNVAPTDKTWYQDACDTVGEMISKPPTQVSLKNSLGFDIKRMTIDQLAHAGEIDVYVNGTKHISSVVPKVPRRASPHKIEHLKDWYESHRDELCNFVADQMKDWSQQEVESNLVDGGKLERSICKFIENECHGPSGETWGALVSTYGMDRNARQANAHRSAQAISKELIEQLCSMLSASREQVLAFYRAQEYKAATRQQQQQQQGVPQQRSIFKDPKQDRTAIPLRNAAYAGVDTDDWANAKQMYNDLAIDAFDQPALRDRIVVLLHRQPHHRQAAIASRRDPMNGGAPKRHANSGEKRRASPLGNPVKEHIREFHMPYYGKHAMMGDEITKESPYYGDYHQTLDAYHLYTGRHPHPMSMMVEGDLSKTSKPRLEPLPKKRTQRLIPISASLSAMHTKKIACGMHKKERKEKEDDDEDNDEYSHYGKKHSKKKGHMKMKARLVPLNEDDVTLVECGMHKKEKKKKKDDDEDNDEYNYYGKKHDKKKGHMKMKARLVPLPESSEPKARLVRISDDEEDLVGDGLPDFEDFL